MLHRLLLSLAAAAGALTSANAQVPDGSVDIGTTGIAGSFTGSGGDWQVSGSGSDIWGGNDHFHFMYFNRSTDVTVTCLVNAFTGSDSETWRKGGIMFRKNLNAGSPNSMIQQTGWGVAHQTRECENCGYRASEHHSYDTEKVWLRLVKQGTTVTSYVKRDGDYGFMFFHQEINVDLGPDFFIGIGVTSHNNANLGVLDISSFEISDTIYDQGGGVTKIGIDDNDDPVWVQETSPGVWSLWAAGYGIGGTSDSFGYLAQEHSGDVSATVHLKKLTRRNGNTKGGLMIRASNAADAPHVSLLVKKNDGLTMYWRDTAGGITGSHNVGVWHEDVELRMVKTGDSVVCMYKHSSAPTWYEIGAASPNLGTSFLVGQAVSSADHGDHALLTTGTISVV